MTSQSQDYFLTASTNKNAADVPLYLINGVPRLSKLLSFSLPPSFIIARRISLRETWLRRTPPSPFNKYIDKSVAAVLIQRINLYISLRACRKRKIRFKSAHSWSILMRCLSARSTQGGENIRAGWGIKRRKCRARWCMGAYYSKSISARPLKSMRAWPREKRIHPFARLPSNGWKLNGKKSQGEPHRGLIIYWRADWSGEFNNPSVSRQDTEMKIRLELKNGSPISGIRGDLWLILT